MKLGGSLFVMSAVLTLKGMAAAVLADELETTQEHVRGSSSPLAFLERYTQKIRAIDDSYSTWL